jgi:hypothetical protein
VHICQSHPDVPICHLEVPYLSWLNTPFLSMLDGGDVSETISIVYAKPRQSSVDKYVQYPLQQKVLLMRKAKLLGKVSWKRDSSSLVRLVRLKEQGELNDLTLFSFAFVGESLTGQNHQPFNFAG